MYFNDYDISRKRPGTEDYIYNIPNLDILHREISHLYGSTIIQSELNLHNEISEILIR